MNPALVQAPCDKCGRMVLVSQRADLWPASDDGLHVPQVLCQECVNPIEQRVAMERQTTDSEWRPLEN